MIVSLPMALSADFLPANPREATDRELLPLARRGQAAACAALVERHRQAAFLFALQLLRDRDDALDVTQDALLRFLSTLDRFDASRPVRPWLFRIVRNCARDWQRRRKVRRAESLSSGSGDEETTLEIPDPSVDPVRDAEQAQLRRQVWAALHQLSEAHREILVLRDYQDLSYAEIADVLAIPIGTVMSRLHAARSSLRTILAPVLADRVAAKEPRA
jgi:RNA polymerase sigma factor (sigma-70 family)